MKILSDFDGVLTDSVEEISRMRQIFLGSFDRPDYIGGIIEELEGKIRSEPTRHGWISEGRLSGFSSEDGFIWGVAISHLLDQLTRTGQIDRSLLESNRFGKDSFVDVGGEAFRAMASETQSGGQNPFDSKALGFFKHAKDSGVEVVVVSNSETDRIVDILGRGGVDLNSIRIRGGAKKFTLAPKPQATQFGNLQIDISRPYYESILRDEMPDAVVGDVFSFDLALPAALGIKTFLRRREYTPQYILENIPKSTKVVEQVSDLLV